ncbi:hypothetical protein ACKKBF_B12090 [Auxenochlorella protothecoides x Auxenochlorella symbiontica]
MLTTGLHWPACALNRAPAPSRELMPPARVVGTPRDQLPSDRFDILEERVVHQRYLTLYDRVVRYPEGNVHSFDVVGHPAADFHFCVVFAFHPSPSGRLADGQVTMLTEYAQGPNCIMHCLPSGSYDPQKHTSWEACARAELSEEAHLEGGTWHCLLPAGHVGVPETKWCANRFTPFLCIGPRPAMQPRPRDAEESTIQVLSVSVSKLRELMGAGTMLLPSLATCQWALTRLEAVHATLPA